MFCPMDPPIEDSVVHISHDSWLLGSTVTCEIVSEVSKDALTSWEDAGGKLYCLRASPENSGAFTTSEQYTGSNEHLVHHAGTSAAVWNIGGLYIKVKAWRSGMPLESEAIRFVNKVSTLPTPEVVHSWIDVQWNRTFLVLKSVSGRTLDKAWTSLSSGHKVRLADKVAQYCKTLASQTSDRLQTADSKGVLEPFLTIRPPKSEPSWKPQILGPFSIDQLQAYLSQSLTVDAIKPFVFAHGDLGPTNIIVDDNGNLKAIIDWEIAAFYPSFWLGTKPLLSAGFYLSREVEDRTAWARLLTESLKREGFAPSMEKYKTWEATITEKYDPGS